MKTIIITIISLFVLLLGIAFSIQSCEDNIRKTKQKMRGAAKYHEGETVYVKPDSTKVVITNIEIYGDFNDSRLYYRVFNSNMHHPHFLIEESLIISKAN